MRFKIDEILPIEAAQLLRSAGHDATTVSEQDMAGAPDADIASACQRENRALVTLDTDFADIRTYPPDRFRGFVVLRLKRQSKPHVLDTLRSVLPSFSSESLARHLWIVEEDRIRIRA